MFTFGFTEFRRTCGAGLARFTSHIVVVSFLLFTAGVYASEVEITILHTNDIHQNIAPLARIAGYADQYKRAHANTLFVDAGDWFDRGSSLVPLTQGEAIYGAMARMGYDMWIVGNHDWAYGGRRLVELIKRYRVPVLATNLATTKPPLPSNMVRTIVKEFDGVRVGFFGITLDTYGKNPKNRPDLYVLDCREQTAKAVAELKRAGVDMIVAVTHLGFKKMAHEVGRSSHPSDLDLAVANPDIDIIIGGHSHTRLDDQASRAVYEETGTIVTQAGALGQYVGRLTLHVDTADDVIKSFEIENVQVTDALPENVEVAAFVKKQYAQYMPNAKTVVGRFEESMKLYNLAFWYADFIRRQADVDLCLLPRKSLYDEHDSFAAGVIDVERLLGYLNDRYILKATVKGSDLLEFCDTDVMRDRFNPFHHRGRPFSGDAMFYSGFDVSFHAEDNTVEFAIDPDRLYTLAVPWPFSRGEIGKYRYEFPSRRIAEQVDSVQGLVLGNVRVLSRTTHELLVQKGIADGLDFFVKFPKPRRDWEAWTKQFEAKLR